MAKYNGPAPFFDLQSDPARTSDLVIVRPRASSQLHALINNLPALHAQGFRHIVTTVPQQPLTGEADPVLHGLQGYEDRAAHAGLSVTHGINTDLTATINHLIQSDALADRIPAAERARLDDAQLSPAARESLAVSTVWNMLTAPGTKGEPSAIERLKRERDTAITGYANDIIGHMDQGRVLLVDMSRFDHPLNSDLREQLLTRTPGRSTELDLDTPDKLAKLVPVTPSSLLNRPGGP